VTADLRVVLAEMRERAEALHGGLSSNGTAYIEASTDLPALLDAVEAVLGLHESVQDGSRCICQPAWRGYPCPTVRAITDALGGA